MAKGLKAELENMLARHAGGEAIWELRSPAESLSEMAQDVFGGYAGLDGAGVRPCYLHNPPDLDFRIPVLDLIGRLWARRQIEKLVLEALYDLHSPLEETFVYAVIFAAWDANAIVRIGNLRRGHMLDMSLTENVPDEFEIRVQPQIGEMHPDFVVSYRSPVIGTSPLEYVDSQLAIELDGHDFHERTKEQARRDKKRDRDLSALGFPVARFTGSEIFAAPLEKATWALDHAQHLAWRPMWQRRFRDPEQDWFALVAQQDWRRTELIAETGFTLEQWAERLGVSPPKAGG